MSISRRSFLVASSAGWAGYRFGRGLASAAPAGLSTDHPAAPAKSTILFFLCGGASHVDTWDMKPDAPTAYRTPFRPIATSADGIQLCEHLPLTAKVAHHLAIVRSVSDFGRATGDHHAGYYYNLTGHAPDQTFRTQGNDRRPQPTDWPFMGSVVGSRRPAHPTLPQIITLPHKPSKLPYTRPGQFAGKLGLDHDPFYLDGDPEKPTQFRAPSLTLSPGDGKVRLDERRALLATLDDARREFERNAAMAQYDTQQQKAFSLLASAGTASAFDLSDEPLALRERYGQTINGMSLLMARRLVEARVPFITVFWKEDPALHAKCKSAGGWDTHGNNFACLRDDLLPEFDRGYSALISDLADRGLLDDTLVLVSSEMGRKPLIGDPRSGGVEGAGRDHWTACMSVLLAGGGIRGGQTYGRTDRFGEYPDEKALSPADITRTVYHAMGIDHLSAIDREGRPFNLLDEGRPLVELF
ncbi:MAG: DUF1501 domain-containing protein [Verrucomicrobiales bacterium]|nr:DUF1501 domain-containing protein [Verrucomicrobiales bacterium]